MGRAIVTVSIGTSSVRKAFPDLVGQSAAGTKAAAPEEKPDTYKDRLFKYIPGEVVTLYLCLTAIVASAGNGSRFLDWAIFCVGLIATPFYLWRWQRSRRASN